MQFQSSMRFNRVLFVLPDLEGHFGWPDIPHTGLGYLASVLEAGGIDYDIIDMNLGYKPDDIMKKALEYQPDIIGISLYTYKYLESYALINLVRERLNTPIVVGGPHVSLFRKKVLEGAHADYAIKNEGEYPLLSLCKGDRLEEIGGLIYRNNGEIVENQDQPHIADIDSITFPKYLKFELQKYTKKMIGIVSSRGCPHLCIFCPVFNSMGRKFRARNPYHIIEELKYWYKKGYRSFDFLDDNFLLNRNRVFQLCELIKKEGMADLILACSQGIRADRVDREILICMKEVGFGYIGLGAESGSNKILKGIKKGETAEQIENAIKIACELGYEVGLFFMIGFPDETLDDVKKSIDLSLKYPVLYANFYNVIPFPDTELFAWIEREKKFLVSPESYLNVFLHLSQTPIFETSGMSLAEKKAAFRLTEKASLTVRKNYMKRRTGNNPLKNLILDLLFTRTFYYLIVKIQRYRLFSLFKKSVVKKFNLKSKIHAE